jgi:hypothetical protein
LFDGETLTLRRAYRNPFPNSDGNQDEFGKAVAAFGTEVLIGAPMDGDGTRENVGAMFFYEGPSTDVAPLAALNKLQWLSVAGNQVGNIQPLVGLKNLETLDLYHNGISDLGPLAGMYLIDDGEAGYSETGSVWQGNLKPFAGSFHKDYRFAPGVTGASTATARWEFVNLVPGTYDVLATWHGHDTHATNALYTIKYKQRLESSALEDKADTVRKIQRLDPDGPTVGGRPWGSLGTVKIDGTTLTVELGDNADGIVIADAIRLVAVNPASLSTPAALPNFTVLDVRGNPLNNDAHEVFVPILQARDAGDPNFSFSFDPNPSAPLWTTLIDPQSGTAGNQLPLSLADKVNAGTDPVFFTASSSHPKVTAVVSGTDLIVTPDADFPGGTARITITAHDGPSYPGDYRGRTDEQTFDLNVGTGAIYGTKFHDLDKDGVQDVSEPGLEGWTMFVDINQSGTLDAGDRYTATDVNGEYGFAGLPASSGSGYWVTELVEPAWKNTNDLITAWDNTGSLTVARWSHTATLLDNGTVLVVGEANGSSPSLAFAELYDPTTKQWSGTGSLATSRQVHTATMLPNGKVLVVGGLGNDFSALASAELYDPATGQWSSAGSLGAARFGHTATLLPDGKVLVMGGFVDGGGVLDSVETYDPVTGQWASSGSLGYARGAHTGTLLANGKVLVAGGHPNSPFWPPEELYDPATGQSSPTGSLTAARYGHTATLLADGRVLVVGGEDNSTRLASAEVYDPTLGQWSPAGSLAEARQGHTATLLLDGSVLVAGGTGNITLLASVELYDPVTGQWSSSSALTTARWFHTATRLASGRVLLVGGGNASGVQASAELSLTGIGHLIPLGTGQIQNNVNLGNLHVADAGPDRRVAEGTQQTFTATFRDPDATPSTPAYQWAVKEGSDPLAPNVATGTGPTITFTPSHEGTYTFWLTISDGAPSYTDSASLFATNVAPSFELGGNETISEGTSFADRVITFTDPGDDTWTAEVDYGDGSTVLTIPESELTDKTFALNHVYADNRMNPYAVTVKVNDGDGGEFTDSFLVTVNNVAPHNVNIVPEGSLTEGSPITLGLDLVAFTDADGITGATYIWSVKEGTDQTAPVVVTGTSSTLTFTPADNDTYQVSLTVTDKDKAPTTTSQDVVIGNVRPSVSAGANETVSEGGTVTRSVAFTDPGADTWTATVDFGDSSAVLALTNAELAGQAFAIEHTYASEGTYPVTITVTDKDDVAGSGTGIGTFQVMVLNAAPVITGLALSAATILEGGSVTLTGTFSDPGLSDAHTVAVTWGDGQNSSATLGADGRSFTATHPYQDDPGGLTGGRYAVVVTVSDSTDASSFDTESTSVVVVNGAPIFSTLTLTPDTIVEGNTVSLSGVFTDAGVDTWTGSINFGDGSPDVPLDATELSDKSFTRAHPFDTPGAYDVVTTLSDDDGGTLVATRHVTVTNLPPNTLTLTPSQASVMEGQDVFRAAGSFSDVSGPDDAWTATVQYDAGAPLPVAVNPGQSFSLDHVFPHSSDHTVVVTITDRFGGRDTRTLIVPVSNVAPVLNVGGDATIVLTDGQAVFTRDITFTDPGQDTWSATVDFENDGVVDQTVPSPELADKAFTVSHIYTTLGSRTVQVTLSDGEATDTKTFILTVVEPNRRPVIGTLSDQTVSEGQAIQFVALVTDPDGNPVTLSLGPGAPAGASINSITKEFTWTPSEVQARALAYDITVIASDGFLPTEQVFHVTVNETNQAPTLVTIPAKTVDEGALLSFVVGASDVDFVEVTGIQQKQALQFSLVNGPGGTTIDPTTGLFTWTPDETQGGQVFTVEVSVTDGAASATRTASITVREVNAPPRLAVDEGARVTFAVSAQDPDLPANQLTFSSSVLPGGAAFDQQTGLFDWTPFTTQGGRTYDMTFFVNDGTVTTSQPVQIVVRDVVMLDIDGDGSANVTDGKLILRHLAGLPDSQVVAGITFGPNATRTTGQAIRQHLDFVKSKLPLMLDADGDSRLNPFTDGRAISRFLSGATDAELTAGSVVAPGAPRADAPALRTFLSQFLPPTTQSASGGLSTPVLSQVEGQHAALSTSENSVRSPQSSVLSSGTPLSTPQSPALKLTINSAALATSSASLMSAPGFSVQMGGEGDDQESPSLALTTSRGWLRDFVVDSAVVTEDPNRDLVVTV